MFLEDEKINMTEVAIKQLKLEYDAWLRTVNYFLLENIYLKNRLGQLVKSSMNHNFIMKLDSFQNSFVEKDTFISLLKRDISEHYLLLNKSTDNDKAHLISVLKSQNKLRSDIQNMEREFNKLKFDFNTFVAGNL